MGIPDGYVEINVSLNEADADRFDTQVKARGFVKQRASEAAIRLWMELPVEAQARLISYSNNGNALCDLENYVKQGGLSTTANVTQAHYRPLTLQDSDTVTTGSLEERVNLFTRELIIDRIKRCKGNLAATARDLGTTPRVVRYKVRELGIDFRRYRCE